MGRFLPLFALFVLLPLLGCGAGGIAPGGEAAPLVLGKVTLRDGSAEGLGGILVECVETGEGDITDADGRFDIDAPVGEDFRIRFDDPRTAVEEETEECEEGADPQEDGEDLAGGEVEIGRMEEGEVCEVEVVLENGEVVEWGVDRDDEDDDGEHDRRHGEARLHPPEGSPLEAVGEVEVGAAEGCCRLEVEVEGRFEGLEVVEVWLVGADGTAEKIGEIRLREGRFGHLEVATCGEEGLPLGAPTCIEREGVRIEIRSPEGELLLEGEVPGLGADEVEHRDGEHEDGHGEGGDDEEGEDEHEEGDGEDGAHDGDGETHEGGIHPDR
jgi:hypothetical protein